MSGLWTWDPETGTVTWSGSVAGMHGVNDAATTLAEMIAAAHPDDRATLQAALERMVDTAVGQRQAYRSVSGARLSAQGQLITVAGRPFVVGSVRPVAPPPAEPPIIDLLQSFPVGVSLLDDNGTFVEVNHAFASLLGYPRDELLGTSYHDLVHPDEVKASQDASYEVASSGSSLVRTERRLVRRDGAVVWALVTTRRIEEDGEVYALSAIEDITSRKQAEDELLVFALHDALTGLPNRRLLLDRLERALSRSRRDSRDVAVLFIDVDHLKRVNDELGHEAGDELLVAVAKNLLSVVRDSDTVARLGGDEFVVVCEKVTTPEELEHLATRMLDAVQVPVAIGSETLLVSASIGVVTPRSPTDRPQDLLRAADAAMYRAKRSGRGRYVIESAATDAGARQRMGLQAEIRRALEREEFVLHYQPIVRLNGEIDSVEALLRWRHPQRGLLGPSEFLSVVSESSLAAPVTDWVLRRAAQDALSWGPDGPPVSVNVTVERLRSPGFAESVSRILAELDLPARSLRLEIPEDQLAETETLVPVLSALTEAGVEFCVDDFGTGYSSLAYLKALPIKVVKLDRSLIATICDDPAGASVVRAVIDACRSTGRLSVAEGVESVDELRLLRTYGCDAIEGALTGMPAPLELLRSVVTSGWIEIDQA